MKIISHAEQQHEEWRAGVETQMQVSAPQRCCSTVHFRAMDSTGYGRSYRSAPWSRRCCCVTGQAEFWIDDKSTILIDGQSLVVPANRKHRFRNIGSETLHIRAVLASSFFEATFDDREHVRRWIPLAAD